MKNKYMKRPLQMMAFLLALRLTVPAVLNEPEIVRAAELNSKVTINYTRMVIGINEKFNLKVTGTTDKITWTSNKPSIATVVNGTVTGKGKGTATITATAGSLTTTCLITVSNPSTASPSIHKDRFGADYVSSVDNVLLDMKSSFESFQSVGYVITGIYAVVHSDKEITVEGLDSKGNSLGVANNNGISYIKFDNAVKLKIRNPELTQYSIDFQPVKPTIISKAGNYGYNDLTWTKMKDGNLMAHVVFTMPNSYFEYVKVNGKYPYIPNYSFSTTPRNEVNVFDPEIMGALKSGYFTTIKAEDAGSITGMKVYVDQYKTYFNDQDIYIYGKTGLTFPKDYKKTVLSYRDLVKKITKEKYLPDTKVYNKPLRIRYNSAVRSNTQSNFIVLHQDLLVHSVPSMNYHEITHYYHLESADYGCQISTWTEGTALAVEEDALKQSGLDAKNAMLFVQKLSYISEVDLNNFETYFVNVGYEDCYAVGYNFIRFIQKNYGSNIIYKINQNIQKNVPKPPSAHVTASYRSANSDKLFIQAVKNATSNDVFTRFVKEFVRSNMKAAK